MRLAWLTDIHLDHVSPGRYAALLDEIDASNADALLIGGDISLADDVFQRLDGIARAVSGVAVYYVLGNHDYYRGSIAAVRGEARRRSSCAGDRGPYWLPERGVVSLTAETALVGHGGWGDATIGDYLGSPVRLNDHLLIEEISRLSKEALGEALRALGADAAASLEPQLRAACESHPAIILLTHVPPYLGACWHKGTTSDPHWAPHFACGQMGTMIDRVMDDYPNRSLTVLCGHTHSAGSYEPRPGVLVLTGAAEYGAPVVQRVLEVD